MQCRPLFMYMLCVRACVCTCVRACVHVCVCVCVCVFCQHRTGFRGLLQSTLEQENTFQSKRTHSSLRASVKLSCMGTRCAYARMSLRTNANMSQLNPETLRPPLITCAHFVFSFLSNNPKLTQTHRDLLSQAHIRAVMGVWLCYNST